MFNIQSNIIILSIKKKYGQKVYASTLVIVLMWPIKRGMDKKGAETGKIKENPDNMVLIPESHCALVLEDRVEQSLVMAVDHSVLEHKDGKG